MLLQSIIPIEDYYSINFNNNDMILLRCSTNRHKTVLFIIAENVKIVLKKYACNIMYFHILM